MNHDHHVSFELLGIVVTVKCAHESCCEQVSAFFSGHSVTPVNTETPDLVVYLEWAEFGRYLYRERPKKENGQHLDGVYFMLRGDSKPQPWRSIYPPLVPYHLSQNEGRFVAIHAASIALPKDRCILLPGDRGAGKTSSSLHLCTKRGGTLVTDEIAFLYVRSRVVVPVLLAMGVMESSSTAKVATPAADLCPTLATTAREVTDIVFLEKGAEQEAKVWSPEDSFRRIMTHVVDVGATSDDTVTTLARLTRSTPCCSVTWNDFASLPRLLDQAINGDANSDGKD